MIRCTPQAGQRIERNWQGRRQCLAFAGFHFRDLALVQDDSAHHLHVVMALAGSPLGDFPNCGENFGEEFVERFAFTVAGPKFRAKVVEFLVGQVRHLGFKFVDFIDCGVE